MAGPSDLVRRAAAETPDRPALIDGRLRLTWRELDDEVTRAARALTTGTTSGDRVGLQMGNTAEFVTFYLGALRAGLVVVPINPAYTLAEVRYVLADSGAKLLVTSALAPVRESERLQADFGVRIAVAARMAPEGLPTVADLLAGPTGSDPRADRDGEDLAVLIYTSGTSGRPRGAMLSTRALMANQGQVAAVTPPLLTAHDVLFAPIPLFHILGLNAALGMALHAGATILLSDRFDASASLTLIAQESVDVVIGVPAMYSAWLADPGCADGFASVRLAISGSAPLPPPVVGAFEALGVPVYEGYGLTEAAPVVSLNAVGGTARRPAPKPGSVGRPLPGIELSLRDPDGSETVDDDPGAIFIRGDNLFSGYWPDGSAGPDAEGWWGTGDIGYLDDDGDLVLVGRDTDLVLVNGFNVYPAEVERVLNEQPTVDESAVVGEPDDTTGEAVVAYVVPAAGAAVNLSTLQEALATELASFKLPSRIEVVDGLPHTVTGKVMKWRLRESTRAVH